MKRQQKVRRRDSTMGYQKANTMTKTKITKNQRLPNHLLKFHLPQIFNNVHQYAGRFVYFFTMAKTQEDGMKTRQPPVNGTNLTSSDTEWSHIGQLRLLALLHLLSETRLDVLSMALQQIPPDTTISMNPLVVELSSFFSYPVSGPCFLLSKTISWSSLSFALTTLDWR